MYDSEDDYDSEEEPELLSEEDMEFLSDHQQDATHGQKTKQSVWGVIDKAKLAHVQVLNRTCRAYCVAGVLALTLLNDCRISP